MEIEFDGEIFTWRGPAPFYFVAIPPDHSDAIKTIAHTVTYGWGVIPVQVQIGKTVWMTSLFPKEDLYLVPVKAAVRMAEKLVEGEMVTLRLRIGM
jgi:hypothetical protein